MNEWFEKLSDFIFSREVAIELIKVAFTALFGFITFKIYQMYRNKKDNSKLYIQMIKLEREIISNLQIIQDVIDNHSRHQLLDFLFRGDNTEGVYDLFELVNSLNQYGYQDYIYENGEPVDVEYVYAERPYEIIKDLNNERHQVETEGEDYQGHLNYIDTEIERLEKKSIYDLLVEIENKAKTVNIEGHEILNSIQLLLKALQKFNAKDITYRRKMLDEFCLKLLNGDNIFADFFKLFSEYRILSLKLNNRKSSRVAPNKIEFKTWQNQDMDLLGIYNSEDYLILEEFYHKNSVIEIYNFEIEKAEELQKLMQTLYEERIKKIKDALKKTLNKTNRLFGKI